MSEPLCKVTWEGLRVGQYTSQETCLDSIEFLFLRGLRRWNDSINRSSHSYGSSCCTIVWSVLWRKRERIFLFL